VTRRDVLATFAGGEVPPGWEKGGDDASWDDVNFTESKNKKIHAVDSTVTNGQ
jgi:hypothetical protein